MGRLPPEDPPGGRGGRRVVEDDQPATARLAAEVGVLAFSTAYARWAAPDNARPFTEIARAALRDLQARVATLGAGEPLRSMITKTFGSLQTKNPS
ncbi:MAG: hypothetical protein ACRDOU_08885 [Streptosporangiaceae bacterium]